MTYQPLIPLSTDFLSTSQGDIKTNFTLLNSYFAIDHVAFNAGSNQGQHKQITFNNVLAVDPAKITPIASLYTKTVNAKSQLFYQNDALVTDAYQLTGPVTVGATGSTTLLGGIILKWGSAPGVSGTATFTTPFLHNCYSVVASILDNNAITRISVNGANVNNFSYVLDHPVTGIYYIAIGN